MKALYVEEETYRFVPFVLNSTLHGQGVKGEWLFLSICYGCVVVKLNTVIEASLAFSALRSRLSGK